MGIKSEKRKITVAMAGNPNVGKSTLFNTLTGMHQKTGNWPGKTVGVATGQREHRDILFEFVDLPGTYGLSGGGEDERIAADFIREGRADWTVVVCDAVALERSLILALQIRQITNRMILCVNLMDEAEKMGIGIDADRLSRDVGSPVILMAAGRNRGVQDLLQLLTKNDEPHGHGNTDLDVIAAAERIAGECVTKTQNDKQKWRGQIDRILVSRFLGVMILLILLFVIIWITVWGANLPSRLLEQLFDQGYVLLSRLFCDTPFWLRGIVIDGAYATGARVISVMLPPMAIFFPLFTLLEDVGYLPRMAFLLDGGMRRCGGCGKQALTMCMGLGCNAVGVTGCRIIESPRERILAILTNAMIPCNGRFPTLILLASLMCSDGYAAVIVGACVITGVLGAMCSSGILSKTALKHRESAFIMEIPPLRRPRIMQILVRSLLDRTLVIAVRALKVAAPSGIILWCLGATGLMQRFSQCLDPIGNLLGMNGVILLAFCMSLPANELLIPVILMTISGAATLQGIGGGEKELLAAMMTTENLVCTMVFTLFHWPCATTVMTIFKETKSYKKTAAAVILPTAVGMILCFILHLLFYDLSR